MEQTMNAKITKTMFGREDHGIMTFMVFIEFSCCQAGIGGYSIDYRDSKTKQTIFSPKGLEAISNILDVVGVSTWEELPGKYIRIKLNGYNEPIREIGNLMEEKWFNIKTFFEE